MIFRYTTPEGVDKSVDTESTPFVNRLAWIKQKMLELGNLAVEYSLLFGVNISPKVVDGNPTSELSTTQTGTIVWADEAFHYGTDVYLTFASPSVALIELLKAFNKPVPPVAPQYADPTPNTTVPDWEVEGSPLAQPLPGQPGCYLDAYGGDEEVGDIWIGPSGKRYEFRVTGFAFFKTRFWKEVA